MDIQFRQAHPSNFQAGRTQPIKYLVYHYTSNNGDTAKNNIDYYATSVVKASAHYYCDERDTIWQSVKDSDTAWAVGGATVYIHPECRNANSISIELCSRNSNYTPPNKPSSSTDPGWYIKPETLENGIRLGKYLMKKYNIPIKNVIRHYDVWGKICPAPMVNNPSQWENLKKRLIEEEIDMDELKKLQEQIASLTTQVSGLSTQVNTLTKVVDSIADTMLPKYGWVDNYMPGWAQPTIKKLSDKGYIKGDETGNLQLSFNDLRHFVVNDRAGIYGE